MIAPPGFQQQSPERRNALLLAFLNARRFPSSNPYGHQVLGGGRGGAFQTNVLNGSSGAGAVTPPVISGGFGLPIMLSGNE